MYNYVLKKSSTIRKDLLDLAHNEGATWRLRHLASPVKVKDIPREILGKDEIIVKLYNKFKDSFQNPVIIRWEPNTQYAWHVDGNRGCALNLLLDSVPFLTLFCNSTSGSKGLDYFYHYDKIEYLENHYNLLNTKIEHTLINFDQPRYLLSIGFENSFDEIKNFCIENNL